MQIDLEFLGSDTLRLVARDLLTHHCFDNHPDHIRFKNYSHLRQFTYQCLKQNDWSNVFDLTVLDMLKAIAKNQEMPENIPDDISHNLKIMTNSEFVYENRL